MHRITPLICVGHVVQYQINAPLCNDEVGEVSSDRHASTGNCTRAAYNVCAGQIAIEQSVRLQNAVRLCRHGMRLQSFG